MRKAGLVGVIVALVIGSATAGYALASRPVRPTGDAARPAPVECAVPAAVATPAPVEIEPAPEPLREERPAPGPARPSARRLIVTHAIEDREPVDELEVVDDLSRGDRLYAFVELANAGEATEVDVVFRHESGLTVGHVALELPAHVRRHRTWAYSTRVEEPGNWTAVVRDRDGRTLAVTRFEVR